LSNISTVIETLQQLERLHQLNLELLEQLNVVFDYLLNNHVPLPNPQLIYSLLTRAKSILAEIQADEPKILMYSKLADEKKQPYRTDEEGTEPPFIRLLYVMT
jgi:hypothetical protein